MSETNKSHKKTLPIWLIILPVLDLVLLIRYLIHGKNVALFNPKGIIAQQQHNLMVFTLAVFFAVAVPAIFLFYFIAWRFRESNSKSHHDPNKKSHKSVVALMWIIPTTVMLILVSVMAPATHRLVPQKTIVSDAKPLTIQVISLRWKWLFIYPDQKVATINYVQLPLNTPVTFEMTADETPMSSFWIPNLGGQLYTMTSHVNRLNLMATTAGTYEGSSAEINGAGFAGMKFTAQANDLNNFNQWVNEVKQSPSQLDDQTYAGLLKPSEYNSAEYFSSFEPTLYANVIAKYEGGHQH